MTAIPRHPLDAPGVIKLAVTVPSEALAAFAGPWMAVAVSDRTNPPESPSAQITLLLLPTTAERADAAYRVAAGLKAKK